MVGFKTLVRREIYRFTSVFKQTIFPPLITSFLYIAIFGYTIGSRIDSVQGIPYMNFLIPGLIMMYVIEGAYQNTSSSLFISRWAGHIQEILVTPLSYVEMVLALLIGGLVRSFVIGTGVFLVSMVFVQIPIQNIFVVAAAVLLVSLTFSSLGAIVAIFAEEFEHLTIWTTFVITPLVFFGGVFHSVHMLPEPLKLVTAFNPIFYMVNAMRFGMLGMTDVSIWICFAVIVFLFIVLFSIAVFLFRIGFKLRR